MADHLALQIMKKIRDMVRDANTRAGANVEVGRTAEVTEPAAVSVEPGDDDVGTLVLLKRNHRQRVYVDLYARAIGHEETVVVALYDLRAQVEAAMLATPSLGLSFVTSVLAVGTREPDLNLGGDRLGFMRTVWDVTYQMAYTSSVA